MPCLVHLAWGHRQRGEQLVRDTVAMVTGADPGPVFHSCPRCGSVEHGRPYVDAAVHVSIAYAADVALVAVCENAAVGVDVETRTALASAGVAAEWVRAEARFKAGGSVQVVDLDAPSDLVAAVSALTESRVVLAVQGCPTMTRTSH